MSRLKANWFDILLAIAMAVVLGASLSVIFLRIMERGL